MKKYIIYTILAITSLVSCQKNEGLDMTKSVQTLAVSLSNDDVMTRVTLTDGDNNVALDWDSDDEFTIYTTSGNRVVDFKYSNKDDDGSINFASTDTSVSLSNNVEYIAIYPSVDGVSTLDAHRAELESRLSDQTQTGNSDNSHLENTLRLEAEFTYSATSETKVVFEHKTATMRLTFATEDGSIPNKIVFSDGDFMSYTVNLDGATEANSYTAHFVIKPNEESIKRELKLTIEGDNYSGLFSVESAAVYLAGVQYRSELSKDDFSTSDGMLIYTKSDLIAFRNAVNGGDTAISAQLMADIDLSGEEWIPIGTSTVLYAGIFDGGGHYISNLYINNDSNYQGLFGYVRGCTISNLTIKDSQINGGELVGGICGYLLSSSLDNCEVTGCLINGSGDDVGGVVGSMSSSSISLCYNTGDVVGQGRYVGGVVGSMSSSSISLCYNTGDVVGQKSSVGGVVGSVVTQSGSISSCYNEGNISGSMDYVGGVVGGVSLSDTTISIISCHNIGDINSDGSRIGGVIGGVIASSLLIDDSYNVGSVNGVAEIGGILGYAETTVDIKNGYNTGDVSGLSKVGGVVGYCLSSTSFSITESYNTGSITGTNGGYTYIGGIVGYASSDVVDSELSITSCYNTGEINNSKGGYTGGIVAEAKAHNVSLSFCYNSGYVVGSGNYVGGVLGYTLAYTSGDIYACYNMEDVSGTSSGYVGGVVGYSSSVSITSSCNTGSVSATGDNVGGIVGEVHSIPIKSCYNTGDVHGSSSVGGIAGDARIYPYDITASYNVGDITGTSNFSYVGGIVGEAGTILINSCYNVGAASGVSCVDGIVADYDVKSSSITSCYYLPYSDLNYSNANGTADTDLVKTMTSSEIISTLNTAAGDSYWKYDTSKINYGYPILVNINY